MNILGKIVDVQMTAGVAAMLARLRVERGAEKQLRMTAYRVAIKRYDCTPNERRRKAALGAIAHCSGWANSDERLSWVLSLIEVGPPEIFWPAFMGEWSVCDDTWHARKGLLRVMERASAPARRFFSETQHEFFDTLPAMVRVFRGCSQPRVRAVAWSTDQTVAEGFARGHRGIRVPEPVIASAVIPKEHIFFVTNDRDEKEVVLNPRRLRRLTIEPYAATVSRAA